MSYPHSNMRQAEIEEFLREPRFAIVGTNRANGPPQQTPVWYLYQDGRIYFSMFTRSAKYQNLRRDPRIGVCIAGNHPDARAVMIYGTVEFVSEESSAFEEINWKVIRRYYDSNEEAQSHMDSSSAEGQSALAVVTPEKVIAQDYN